MAAAIFVKRDEEDAIESGLEAGRNTNERGPPAGDSLLGSKCEDLVSKLNVLLRLSHLRPVFENGLPSAQVFDARGNLIGAVFREEVRCGLRVAAFPRAAVGVQPGCERVFHHTHVSAREYTKNLEESRGAGL